ncbi:MAG TPA: carboxypeptidase-like regulatory domain-containing protein [Conexibacter sp.]|nr:carboxypeptidase-like regulatory domain-containing protein [Conexibacter sp.]
MANRSYLLQMWHDEDVNAGLLDFKKPLQAGQTLVQVLPSVMEGDNVSWRSLHLGLSCWAVVGNLDCGPFPAQVTISRATIGLTDMHAPEGTVTGGSLAGTDSVRGVASLSVHATDDGGGVYRVALAIDGREVARHGVADPDRSCADVEPANGDAYEFGTSRPCPLSTDGAVQVNTATLRDGQHTVHVTLEDAAGNQTVVFDGIVRTHNAPINAVAPALTGQASVGSQLNAGSGQWDGAPSGFDHRWLRCEADGTDCDPIAGATGTTYTLTDADAYHRMKSDVTAENGSGASTASSPPSAIVTDAAGRTAPPSGQGTPGTGGGGAGGGTTPPRTGGAGSGGETAQPGPGGIQGNVNPLGQAPGHVANGDNAAARARIEISFQLANGRTARRIRTRHGQRSTIVGRLTDASGAAIGGARIGAAWRIAGHDWVAHPGIRTGADGRFVYVLPPGPSRDVRFTYFAFSDSRAVELSNVVHADVLAPLTIRADRGRVTGTRVVRLSGHVGGGPVPRTGLLVTLQGYQRGWGWRTFRTVRTDRKGNWSTSYRFRLSEGRFGFRALVPHQGRFPFATSRSDGVFVVVS